MSRHSLEHKVRRTSGYEEACSVLGETKVFMFSTPHSGPAGKCVESLKPHLEADDVLIDCGNEHWENTERRQRDLDPKGVHYIGYDVSGGYQRAGAGPSMSPGGSVEGLAGVMPFLRSIAATDSQGQPCANPDMMFMVAASGLPILHPPGEVRQRTAEEVTLLFVDVLNDLVSDLPQHAFAAFILGALDINTNGDKKAPHLGQQVKPQKLSISSSRDEFIEALQGATYFCFLACFAQGLDLIRQKDKDKDWKLDYRKILQLWRGGCIIKAEHITDLLDNMYARADHDPDDILGNEEIGRELSANFQATKKVVLRAMEADLFVPPISQTLEYYKYETSTHLPTQFMEAQLDYFGSHMFERKDDPMRGVEKGEHHYEWKPAKGSSDK
ncbi:hypothetical protein NUW58_g4171 [Xylaria curta]|uniref:Uncharacterized protein n=1 Tax=Xylaria curta TaxID=42375 RepID=A0ACC1P989_9PEZI|nr:hypothetical protein NUW58_g4171 [Xylaria curta]